MLSAAPCLRIALHYLTLPAQSLAQATLFISLHNTTPQPCLEDREALPAGDEDAMLSQKAKFLSSQASNNGFDLEIPEEVQRIFLSAWYT